MLGSLYPPKLRWKLSYNLEIWKIRITRGVRMTLGATGRASHHYESLTSDRSVDSEEAVRIPAVSYFLKEVSCPFHYCG